MAGDMHILRLGYQNRANYLPLLYPVEAGWAGAESPWTLEVVSGGPGVLLEGMLNGSLDAAFLSPVAVAQHGGMLSTLGGWGLACEGRVETALLLAPQRLDLMHEADVNVSPEAQGSTAEHLLRILLKPYYGIDLQIHLPDDPAYDPKGASLLYGDDGAREAASRGNDWVAEDLGVAWFVFTGLPVVWEMLVVHRDLEERKPGASEQLQALLSLSQRTAREQQATVSQVGAQRLGISEAAVKELFGRQSYTLGAAEQKGLARFLTLAGPNRSGR